MLEIKTRFTFVEIDFDSGRGSIYKAEDQLEKREWFSVPFCATRAAEDTGLCLPFRNS